VILSIIGLAKPTTTVKLTSECQVKINRKHAKCPPTDLSRARKMTVTPVLAGQATHIRTTVEP